MMRSIRRGARGEQASLPLALIVVLLVSGLVVVLVGRTLSAQRQVSYDETYHGVLPAGDTGVQEAQFKLNANAELEDEDGDSYSRNDFPVGATTAVFDGVVDGRNYEWTMTRLDELRWEVDSLATDPRTGVERRVVATIRDQPLVAIAAFTESLLAMSGSNSADSYNSSSGDWCTGQGFVASNEDVEFSGNASGDCQTHNQRTVDQVVLYDWLDNPGANADATRPGGMRCRQGTNNMNHRNCIETGDYPAARTEDERQEFATDSAIAFIEDALNACEVAQNGSLDDYVASEHGAVLTPAANAQQAIDAGDFALPGGHYCYENLDFDTDTSLHSTATTSNPVIIFVRNEVTLRRGQGQPRVDVGCIDCEPLVDTPAAGRLWIFALNGDVLISNHSTLAGVMWAPRATCKGYPSNAQADIYGSIICDTIDNAGGWRYHYDDALADRTSGDFFPESWSEQPTQ